MEEKIFYNNPSYLVLDLNEGEPVEIEGCQLDLSKYSIKPGRYELYAVINKIIDSDKYICSIKKDKIWICYEDGINNYLGNVGLEVGIPSFIIYKKI